VRPPEELPATAPSIDGESSIHEATVSYGHFKPTLLVAGTESNDGFGKCLRLTRWSDRDRVWNRFHTNRQFRAKRVGCAMNTVRHWSLPLSSFIGKSPHHANLRDRVTPATGRSFKRWQVHIAVLLGAILVLLPLHMFGQAVNAALLGTVSDSSGAVVSGAKVTVTEMKTAFRRLASTNSSGNYLFADLPPGQYEVAVDHEGFRRAVRSSIDVLVNSDVRVDLVLQPGSASETVVVTGEAPILQTDRADIGRKIETRQVEDLPLTYNRNFQGLLNLVPGTTRAHREHSSFFNAQDSLRTEVNGQSGLANNLQFEGVDDNERTGLLQVYIPPIEAIQTVDVTTSNFDAELGRADGAVTNVILKSGSNEFHGAAYEINRISALLRRKHRRADHQEQDFFLWRLLACR
jgi:Carboxypeptidase regulatory-like domain